MLKFMDKKTTTILCENILTFSPCVVCPFVLRYVPLCNFHNEYHRSHPLSLACEC